jgi:hypothetical protein
MTKKPEKPHTSIAIDLFNKERKNLFDDVTSPAAKMRIEQHAVGHHELSPVFKDGSALLFDHMACSVVATSANQIDLEQTDEKKAERKALRKAEKAKHRAENPTVIDRFIDRLRGKPTAKTSAPSI